MRRMTIGVAMLAAVMGAGAALAQYGQGYPAQGYDDRRYDDRGYDDGRVIGGAIAPLGERESGSVVRVRQGTVLTVRLQRSAGTNYDWRLVRTRDVQLAARPTTSALPVRRGYVGGPEVVTFQVRVTGAGQVPVVFRLAPNGPGDVGPMRTVVYVVDTSGYY